MLSKRYLDNTIKPGKILRVSGYIGETFLLRRDTRRVPQHLDPAHANIQNF